MKEFKSSLENQPIAQGPDVLCVTPKIHDANIHIDLITWEESIPISETRLPLKDKESKRIRRGQYYVYNPRTYADDWDLSLEDIIARKQKTELEVFPSIRRTLSLVPIVNIVA